MGRTKEYKGEKIAASLTARLIPPSMQYSDSFCQLILTVRHLYILEDNYDGTYNVLFTFFLERIRDMEAQVKGLRYEKSVLGEIFRRCLEGLFMLPEKRKKITEFVLSSHTMTVWEKETSCILRICNRIPITW